MRALVTRIFRFGGTLRGIFVEGYEGVMSQSVWRSAPGLDALASSILEYVGLAALAAPIVVEPTTDSDQTAGCRGRVGLANEAGVGSCDC